MKNFFSPLQTPQGFKALVGLFIALRWQGSPDLDHRKLSTIFYIILLFFFSFGAVAQVTNTGTIDTTDVKKKGKLTVGGYIDVYDTYYFGALDPEGNRPYSYNNTRHNEITINLAYVDVKYSSSRVRARLVPGFGTYIEANYKNEPSALRNFVEASVGLRLFEKKQIWLEAGVIGSPYTNESYVSKDHLMYTRSLSAEYVPYYLSGAKLSVPLHDKVNAYFYLFNGWQVIQDNNEQKAFGTQLEYRPSDKLLLNWNTFMGDERSKDQPDNRMRYFTDVYAIYNPTGKFSFTSCAYVGVQNRRNLIGKTDNLLWWQANFIGSFRFSENVNLAGRVEYFNDQDNAMVRNIVTNAPKLAFETWSLGTCLNVTVFGNAMFRLDGRWFLSPNQTFVDISKNPAKSAVLLTGNITVWF